MASPEIPIAIIGAGPAGLSAALHLIKFDPTLAKQILVLEKANHPRPKLCGGGLTEDAETILRGLGLDINEIPNKISPAIQFQTYGFGFKYKQTNTHTLRIVSRIEFDAWLAAKATERGVKIRQGVTVLRITQTDGYCHLETSVGEVVCRVVVLAEGSNGTLSHQVFPQRLARKARLIEAFIPSAINTSTNATFDYSQIKAGLPGYYWDFPTPNGQRSIGLFAADIGSSPKDNLFEKVKAWHPELSKSTFKGHPILQFTPRHDNQAGQVIAIGDCAGADPLLGEGISFALGSGYFAARHITQAFSERNGVVKSYQWEIIKSSMGRSLYIRWCIGQIIFNTTHPWLQRLIWKTLNPIVQWIARNWLLGWALKINR